MSEHDTHEDKEICMYCHHEFMDMQNVISIQETGSCLNCDHVLGEITEAQAGEPMFT